MTHILVNGRALAKRPVGVRRYLAEILWQWGDRQEITTLVAGAQGLPGHLWEQVILPSHCRNGELLWSPANTGPLSVSNQVLTLHDMRAFDIPETFGPGAGAWMRHMTRGLAKRCRAVITVSEFSRGRIVAWLFVPEERVHVIPNGVNKDQFRPLDEEKCRPVLERLGVESPYFLAVGGSQPHKNISLLEAAWDRTGLAQRGIALLVLGRPGRRPNHAPGVRWLAGVPDEDLPALYSSAIAALLPSRYEGFGLPALEAMACGTPVIASRAGALPEVAGDAALLLPPDNAGDWADAMLELEKNAALRQSLAARGRRRAAAFDWGVTAERTMRALQDAA